ncbi:AAA family ATPase [Salmonella enterica]|uniref:AAA family ATPase n=1 Tax=Salmonella enterica TaxID=28901 RepID=UPI0009B0C42B|nr:AAA family ATPase [Salmonella enterica]EDI0785074.1 ParA family protein [Salmonella enterica subsp. enterica serovar Kasenyi]EDS4118781.1 ParA family protein [Salmonella enterica subsp. enterica serovar Braenderup]EHV6763239.1 AAA family ATPase [Salmonella enterica subsp. enterica serovar Johannesburg]EEE3276430.1 ParA family protein [Salmonella enterica subsp. enterica serovar Braenderup]EIY6650757.1 AAA family ATPase [Salmonella enterica]
MIDVSQLQKVAQRANKMLHLLTDQVQQQKDEYHTNEFHQVYAKAALSKLPKLTRANVDYAVSEMEEKGYVFDKRPAGSSMKYAMSIQNIIDIYQHRGVPKYRDRYDSAYVIFVANLKGGVSKTVSTVSLAHAMRAHPHLLFEDLRILVIDLDPQSSATMFLNHKSAVGIVNTTSAQAMLQNVTREELLEEFVVPSVVPGVDVMPASIDDAFIASDWKDLCSTHLAGQNVHAVLRENVIDKLRGDYDFILVDSGPHLDAFLKNALASADILFTPLPPATVDFHSSLKYVARLPELVKLIDSEGCECKLATNIGFMSKLSNKPDHKYCHSLAKEVFGGDMLDVVLPRLDGFERCGESFDTVISANPSTYVGSTDALKNARIAAEDFAKAVFDRIEFIRSN